MTARGNGVCEGIPYTVIRSSRRTVAIHITREGRVEVRAPYRTPDVFLEEVVCSREKWIREHLALQQQKVSRQEAFTLADGVQVPVWGQELTVRTEENAAAPRLAAGEILLPPGEEAARKVWMETLFREEAAKQLPQITAAWSARTGLVAAGVRITGARTRWGSCSGENRICYSWRLAAAPLPAVEYVVIHELAHTRHHDHSARFWELVERYLPDWRQRRELLRTVQDLAEWL